MPDNALREALAAYAHEAWSGWMRYMLPKLMDNAEHLLPAVTSGGAWKDSARKWLHRWLRQVDTPYADLPEEEKQSDRDEADKMIGVMCRAAFVDGEWPEQTILLEWMQKNAINIIFSKRMDLLNRMTLLRLSNGGEPPEWRLPDWEKFRSKVAVIVSQCGWDHEDEDVDAAVEAVVKAAEELMK